MSKRVYISADYSEDSGDRNVVETLNKWGTDKLHKVDFIDMAKVVSGSISSDSDCRACDLKKEFNNQINASSAVIIVIGDKTKERTAGSSCQRSNKAWNECSCTPYKQNANGAKICKAYNTSDADNKNVENINTYSYIRHEFEQAQKSNKEIIVVYNSLRNEVHWLPVYMKEYESVAQPFWIIDSNGNKVGDYSYIKEALGYE
ncbi:MAG: TIR domain-containing protein [Ruminococcus sp.]|nr:TIR domain-containing protein [Ruminococcus sp.]